MSKLIPANDFFMIEVGKEVPGIKMVGGINPDEGIREGIVVGISDQMTYYGMNTFAFDKSLDNPELLNRVYEHYKTYVGKKVYWPERSESGAVISYGDKTYAFVKFSSIMSVEVEE